MAINKISELLALTELEESGKEFITLFQKGQLTVEIYKPHMADKQTPHDRDEFYLIISGEGKFQLTEQTTTFKSGDFLYVPAFSEHRFIEFTKDFVTWVFFLDKDISMSE
ncbi:cupin domain-containing protein [Arenibacter palladensis]|uniref:cupin domain-containing protein n=1 Tax=Arenibacter palladensis TaxID=237373 RepID=UPI0026E2BB42|nr:cupin domain-containing protein [Arenibacter palladensis]MDO6602166.1 cupin domain-containing protein [Arenibacter palladensis]